MADGEARATPPQQEWDASIAAILGWVDMPYYVDAETLLAGMSRRHDDLVAGLHKIKGEYDLAEQRLEAAQREIARLKEEYNELETEHSELRAEMNAQVEQYNGIVEHWRDRAQAAEQRIRDLEAALQDAVRPSYTDVSDCGLCSESIRICDQMEDCPGKPLRAVLGDSSWMPRSTRRGHT